MADYRIMWRKPHVCFRRREQKSARIVERVPGGRGKAPVPHQVGVEGSVRCGWCPPLVAGTAPVRPHQTVILDADCDGLSVAHSVAWRVAPAACVVTMQATQYVKPEQPSKIG